MFLLAIVFSVIIHQITIIQCEETIDCGVKYPITEFDDGAFSLRGKDLWFLLHLYDKILYSSKKNGEVDITANSLSATLFGPVHMTRTLENGTKETENTYIGYENFFSLRGFGRANKTGRLAPLRLFLIHDEKTRNFDKVSKKFQRFFLRETEVCLEDHLQSNVNVTHELHRVSIYETICPAPEIPYVKPVTTEFQRIIDKVADISIHQIVENFVAPTKGIVLAPNITIDFSLFMIPGTFEAVNGSIEDLRSVRRNSHVIYTHVGNKGNAVVELEVGPAKVLYKNCTLYYVFHRACENLTLSYAQGLSVKAMVQVDVENFPCDIKIQSLLVNPKGPAKPQIPSSLSLISGPIVQIIKNEEKRILKQFAEEFRKQIHREMLKVDCKTLSFIDYLERSFKKNLNATAFFNPPTEVPPIHDAD